MHQAACFLPVMDDLVSGDRCQTFLTGIAMLTWKTAAAPASWI
jgi:hypothetical protein